VRDPRCIVGYLQSDLDHPTGVDVVVLGEGRSWAQAFRDAERRTRDDRLRMVTA
jgi:hypothetical protein